MKQNRLALGLSISDAATRAGISANTLRRLEAGFPIHESNLAKLWRVYGAVPVGYDAVRASHAVSGKNYRLQTLANNVWYAMRLDEEGRSESFRFGESLTPEERNRLGRYKLATHFSIPFRVRRDNSRFMPFLVEVSNKTDVVCDPSGERFIYGLRGQMRVYAGDESFILSQGEGACFDSTKPTCLEPAEVVDETHPAPQALVVVLP